VEQLGWTPADVLKAGMRLATLGGEWVSVLVVPNAEMIFVLLRGMTLYEIPYRASTETVERSVTSWEIWELMTNNRYIDKRPAMRFDWGDGTSMMDYPAFRERMRDVFLPHVRTEAQENPSWATSRGLKPYTIRSIIRLGYTVGEVETMLATP
jgi:hypothetical protein